MVIIVYENHGALVWLAGGGRGRVHMSQPEDAA